MRQNAAMRAAIGGIHPARAAESLVVMILNNAVTSPGAFEVELRKLD